MAYNIDGFNPRYGYYSGAAYPYPDPLAYGYGQPVYADVPFVAPAGHQWIDISVLAGGLNSAHPLEYGPPPPYGYPSMPYYSPGPAHDGGIPGVHFRNAHGGVGCEPGYDYLFPPNHTKIHILESKLPPWENATQYSQRSFNVPTGLKVKEVMQQFGCNNKVAAKNKLHELTQGGDGRWYKGITICGDDKKELSKAIEDVGWNKTRDGIDQDFVWMWFEK